MPFLKKLLTAVLLTAGAGLSAQLRPAWVDVDFTILPEQGVSASGHAINIGENGEVDDGVLELDGSEQAYLSVYETAGHARIQPDGKTLSGILRFAYSEPGWFSDEPASANSIYFGAFEILLNEKKIPSIRFYAKPGDLLGPTLTLTGKDPLEEDELANLTFRYSVAEQRAEFFLNGEMQAFRNGALPELNMSLPYAGQNFCGKIAHLRLYDGYMRPVDLHMKQLTEDDLNNWSLSSKNIAENGRNPFLRAQAETMQKMLTRLEKHHCTLAEILEIGRRLRDLETYGDVQSYCPFLTFSATDEALRHSAARLPALPDSGIKMTDILQMETAQDSQAHTGFILYPLTEVRKFEPILSNLKSPEGYVLPAAALKISALEYRYVDDTKLRNKPLAAEKSVLALSAFTTDPGRSRLNHMKRRNELRAVYPDSEPVYLPQESIPARFTLPEPESLKETSFPLPCHPQMFLLEVKANHVPAALYSGEITLLADGQNAGSLKVQIKVLPPEAVLTGKTVLPEHLLNVAEQIAPAIPDSPQKKGSSLSAPDSEKSRKLEAIQALLNEQGTKEKRKQNIEAAKVIAGSDFSLLIPCYAAQIQLSGFKDLKIMFPESIGRVDKANWHSYHEKIYRAAVDKLTLEDDPAEMLKYFSAFADSSVDSGTAGAAKIWMAEIIWRFSRADGQPTEDDALKVVRLLEESVMRMYSGEGKEATVLIPKDEEKNYYTLLAQAHLLLNNSEAAQTNINALQKIDPAAANEIAGDLAMKQKRYPEAYIAYGKAGDRCLIKQAKAAMICAKFEHALACLQQAKQKNPAEPMLDVWLRNLEEVCKTYR